MRTKEKLTRNITLHLDEPTAQQVETLAEYYNRKPAEFLRLILAPTLRQYWAEMERNEHAENRQEPTLATFRK